MPGARVVETPCKVNLHLGVHAQKDARGYHLVDSVMVPVALFDTVSVSEAPELSVIVASCKREHGRQAENYRNKEFHLASESFLIVSIFKMHSETR